MAEINDDMDRTRATTAAKAAYEAKSFEVENVFFFVEKVKRTTRTVFFWNVQTKSVLNWTLKKIKYVIVPKIRRAKEQSELLETVFRVCLM